MWFIIWRGWGILVVPLAFFGLVGGVLISIGLESARVPKDVSMALGAAAASVLAGIFIWFTAKALSGGPQRRLVDADSGQQYVLKRDAGSLFFIPMRFWAFFVGVAGLLMSLLLILPQAHETSRTGDTAAPSSGQSASE